LKRPPGSIGDQPGDASTFTGAGKFEAGIHRLRLLVGGVHLERLGVVYSDYRPPRRFEPVAAQLSPALGANGHCCP
jgi:hypothetical protein